ncbi:hypothetical protein AAE02nite_43230 [Adhaeribacter aerolatus]|uniref:Uncharacterized protein n=1 Tax=Adhaeribacter aerolatus TaxID=670289 RepID=A0A512B3X4_9BACT|nr:hypothetical protein [Adhaeribacter aerolatus]GEO06659.1 hypothetical protein AAE02nite_43230 [Adhaeribacter aerolatus]
MIEVNTLSFRLRLERKAAKSEDCLGNYFYVLFCESPFDVSKTFSEEFLADFNSVPFYSLCDAARFAEEMASFWEKQILINPKLDITRLEELTDVWRYLSQKIQPKVKEFEAVALEC